MGPGTRRYVLVVDDTDDLRELWRLYLTLMGFEVLEASNGADAIELVRRSQPDIVVMDMWMPVMNGLEAICRLKADGSTARVPVIAVTAHGGAEIARLARAAGCDEFCVKPVTPEGLLRVVGRHLRPTA